MSAPDFSLIVLTDQNLAAPRSIADVVEECLEAGAPAIQLRQKQASAAELFRQARELRDLTTRHDALFFVNDRLDVALAVGADGVHLGPDDLPVGAARKAVDPDFLIGFSADDPDVAREAEAEGADYIGCGVVYGTENKKSVAGERLGVERVGEVAAAVGIPVIGIGGITPENAGLVRMSGARGVAVLGAVMGARSPGEVVKALLSRGAPFEP